MALNIAATKVKGYIYANLLLNDIRYLFSQKNLVVVWFRQNKNNNKIKHFEELKKM